MEPFSIFQLLESLFSANPNQSPAPTNENASAENMEKPSATTQNTSIAGGEQTDQIEQSSSAQDAVVAFLSAHETRAKRTRR